MATTSMQLTQQATPTPSAVRNHTHVVARAPPRRPGRPRGNWPAPSRVRRRQTRRKTQRHQTIMMQTLRMQMLRQTQMKTIMKTVIC